MSCPSCGTVAPAGSRFCPSCGTTLPSLPAPVAAAPPRSGAAVWWLAGTVGVLVVVVAVLVTVLVTRSSGTDVGSTSVTVTSAVTSTAGSGPTSTSPSTTTTAPSTTTTVDLQALAALKAEQDLREVATKLEGILDQSSSGRGRVGALVDGVRNGCQFTPEAAEQEINGVIANRQSVLNQLAALDAKGNPEAITLVQQLQSALQASIDADVGYRDWMVYLYTTYYYTEPIGCPGGFPPTNASFDAGQAASGRATAAKQAFVATFNPIASRYGLATWDASQI